MRLHSVPKRGTINVVSIANQVPRCVAVNECLDNMLADPLGGRMLGDVEMQHLTSAVFQDDQDKEDSKRGRRDGEEINRDDTPDVVLENGSPPP